MDTLYELLLFPNRAEDLDQYQTYDVDLEHWKALSTEFREVFRAVYERGSSAVLLVHGAQGTGKTLFSKRLAQDFGRALQGAREPDSENLWHTLVGDTPPKWSTIETATQGSRLHRVDPVNGWLTAQRAMATNDKSRVRVFILDDAHKDVFVCEWAGLSREAYLRFKADKSEGVVLESVAQKLVEDCRGDFRRSIFLLLSNDAAQMKALKAQIDRSHVGLAKVLELPLPAPEIKEKIIRKNTNRLNRMSYWCCLDAAGKEERCSLWDVLMASDKGFTESFVAVDRALRSGETRRAGRPANRNLLTFVTLGAPPSTVRSFVDDFELTADEHFRGDHLGVWLMREQWASKLYMANDPQMFRRVRMLESEFALRWVALDMKATALLCERPQSFLSLVNQKPLVQSLLDIVRFLPSIAKPEEVKKHGAVCTALDEAIQRDASLDIADFTRKFMEMGQSRSRLYEPALGQLLGSYSRGLAAFPALRPDFIVEEYRPCAVTAAKDHDGIKDAIKRSCHVIEFTAHVQNDMRGLKEYLLGKVERYAVLLESV
ncbi:hypothetical protein [Nannocystis pusilla]|uniref:AAA+ ATPase domain-containing protein n=1 Tax=Nannocystis pusilla TaxID=889268 RepID=A0ABS7TSM8_9BACT|nr:hypothetical protein [Nannocystis pusilla]MBZ5711176.1 hypothetical protein [Nannocystis pusilla]